MIPEESEEWFFGDVITKSKNEIFIQHRPLEITLSIVAGQAGKIKIRIRRQAFGECLKLGLVLNVEAFEIWKGGNHLLREQPNHGTEGARTQRAPT
jgi:hypothetical protein